MRFPEPLKIGASATRWRLSDLEAYEAACAGEPAPTPRPAEDELFLSVRSVAARYNTHPSTIWRMLKRGDREAA